MSDITTLNGYDLQDGTYSGSTYTNYANQVSSLESTIASIKTYADQCQSDINSKSSSLSSNANALGTMQALATDAYDQYSQMIPSAVEGYLGANNVYAITLGASSITNGRSVSTYAYRIDAGIGYNANGSTRNSLSDVTSSYSASSIFYHYLTYGRKSVCFVGLGRIMWPVQMSELQFTFQQYRIYLNGSTPYIAPARVILAFNSTSSNQCTAYLYATAAPLA